MTTKTSLITLLSLVIMIAGAGAEESTPLLDEPLCTQRAAGTALSIAYPDAEIEDRSPPIKEADKSAFEAEVVTCLEEIGAPGVIPKACTYICLAWDCDPYVWCCLDTAAGCAKFCIDDSCSCAEWVFTCFPV